MKRPFHARYRPLYTILTGIVLTGCVMTAPQPPPGPPPRTAASGLDTARNALDGGQLRQARVTLDGLPVGRMTPSDRARYRLLRGRLAMASGAPDEALKILPPNPTNPGTAPAILKIRAQALFAMQRPVAATEALVKRSPLLTTPDARARNRDAIWDGLTGIRLGTANLRGLNMADSITRGWVQLAILAEQRASLQAYTRWQATYPNHPGASHLQRLLMPQGSGSMAPVQGANPGALTPFELPPAGAAAAALLLPLTGSLATAANAVRNGYETERNQLGGTGNPVFDTGTSAQALQSAFRQALNSGAGAIVGPLQKSGVAAINQLGAPTVPVLALNYLDPGATPSPGLVRFGLSPDDQARQIADDAFSRGLRRAVALVPDNARASGILAAFTQRLTALGGTVVSSAQYPQGTTKFSPIIRGLLDIDASITRDKNVANALGQQPEFQPRRRADVDFIFISGQPTAARLMASLFRYWHANRLPIYATADANNRSGNHDLINVRFCTAPWKLEPGPQWDAVRNRITQATGGNTGLQPLYALGMDAARIMARLRQGPWPAGHEIAGYTGELSLNSDGVIHRRLACAQITADGRPQMLSGVPLPVPGARIAATVGTAAPSAPAYPSLPAPFPPSQALPRAPIASPR